MLARTLVIAAMAVLVYYLYRRWSDAQKVAEKKPPKPQPMKKCAHCGVHLPKKRRFRSMSSIFAVTITNHVTCRNIPDACWHPG